VPTRTDYGVKVHGHKKSEWKTRADPPPGRPVRLATFARDWVRVRGPRDPPRVRAWPRARGCVTACLFAGAVGNFLLSPHRLSSLTL